MDVPVNAWHNEQIGQMVVKALKRNLFEADYVPDIKTALNKLLTMIPEGASIGCGGSVTKNEIGLMDELKKRGHEMIDWHIPNMTAPEKIAARRKALTCNVFLASSNAVTLDGQLINLDGTGNRIGSIAFGPDKVIIIAGINKIVPDIDTGLKRIQQIAAPKNNKRLNLPNPCTTTGVCMNCSLPTRICNVTTIMHKRPSSSNIFVLIVGESLGY